MSFRTPILYQNNWDKSTYFCNFFEIFWKYFFAKFCYEFLGL